MAYAYRNLAGMRYGRLQATWPVGRRMAAGTVHIVWLCVCDCGKLSLVESRQFGHIKSCGCLQLEHVIRKNTTHGRSGSYTWVAWRAMRRRCDTPSAPRWKDYGGRGIRVCERWHTFENFLADMGERPKGLTLDRYPNNDGNYEPGNCRWATPKEQAANRRPRHQGK